jgi:hypothetical protein
MILTGYRDPKGCKTSRLAYYVDNWLTDSDEVSVLGVCRALLCGRLLVLISVRSCVYPRTIMWLDGFGQLKMQ